MGNKKETAHEGSIQEQLTVMIQAKDNKLINSKVIRIQHLVNELNDEIKSLPDMFEFKV